MAVRMAYFPRSKAEKPNRITKATLPARPVERGPVFDVENSQTPLSSFDEHLHGRVYAGPSETGEAIQPEAPAHFDNKYLYPSLAHNERLRLTLLWYHTRLIEQDEILLSKIDALVNGLQQAIGWEYAIAGMLSESTYTRLATAHLPIARLPRREATCAHTINQAPSSVFMINDMSKDWRFKESPHVEIGGLKSYAGTQLRLLADDGEEVSLGSLCVASDFPQPPLSQAQRDLIVRFAELISTAIASHTRARRQKDRETMAELISTLEKEVELDYEKNALKLVKQAYPSAQVTLQASDDGTLAIDGRSPLSFSDVYEGLWEDTNFIEQTINTSNHAELRSGQTVRAIVARCGSSNKYLVVASTDIHFVFDDFDAWYVTKAASIIADTLQRQLLQQALEARETFLRGMTHQLRTPIHGILGSVELLTEELAAARFLENGYKDDGKTTTTSPSACLTTIRNSGKELMTTVNNILKHNTWTDALRQCQPGPYDIRQIENDVLPEILALLPREQLRGVSIDFRFEVPEDHCIITTDVQMLKDCVQAVILNAIQSVQGNDSGVVSASFRVTTDFSWLLVDIVDNGVGIDFKDHARIFEPYEKVDSHKPGVGLGLTLAKNMAHLLNGNVKLVSSAPKFGSHFHIEFKNPDIACLHKNSKSPALSLDHIPRRFAVLRAGKAANHFVDHVVEYLTRNGFQLGSMADAPLIVTNTRSKQTIAQLFNENPRAAILSMRPNDCVDKLGGHPGIIAISGPLHTQQLDRILQQADRLYRDSSKPEAEHLVESTETISQPKSDEIQEPEVPEILKLKQLGLEGTVGSNTVDTLPLKALLVDDNLINLRVLQMYCHKRKIPYITAEDGNRACQKYREAAEAKVPFTLVLMDLQMPHCDGIQATTAIRSYETTHEMKKSSIFMVTGQDSVNDKIASQNAGADEFLVKPVGPRDLDTFIRQYFSNYIPT
ncbi:hypothetical protein PFICI_14336 [Pestalotiopsis fici W106-1]|uniref:histidine kinase n=1 Tax=Pestalotiopsis fici (strain W106-1 / CGMCC3.15140) TaxID=1229662 RepID=W3WKL3_PESFW|nr:uncharacterized protein PFICI_14336 [Pestalotiopsis fici W106-1]ETS74470.1 hypothetical protein PFICI_14336 [Pestalotiopsis fici W106-1]